MLFRSGEMLYKLSSMKFKVCFDLLFFSFRFLSSFPPLVHSVPYVSDCLSCVFNATDNFNVELGLGFFVCHFCNFFCGGDLIF